MGNLRVFHEEILQEENVKVSELPVELQKRIKGFNLMRNRLEKNPEDEKLFIQLQKQAIKLGDDVQNFIENDYDEDEEENDDNDNNDDNDDKKSANNKSEKNSKSDSKKSEDSNKSDGGQVEKQPRKPSGKFGNLMMEKKILAIMDARGEKRIKISDLESIIGREPSYPEQEVNNITLRKVFLSSDYRLV